MDDGIESLRDAAFVVIGLGVLGFQRAQVRRRELTKKLSSMEDYLPPAVRDGMAAVCDVLKAGLTPRQGS